MRLAFGLVITLVALLDSIECSGRDDFRNNFRREEPDYLPPPPHLRREPEPFPENWIRYPFPYYYDEHGVIRDYMNPGSEGLIFNGNLVGMIRPNGRREFLSRNNLQYIIDLPHGQVHYRAHGAPRIPATATPSSSTQSSNQGNYRRSD